MTVQAASPTRHPEYGNGREALLRAAIRVVGKGGLRRLTYRVVAAEAGVTHGLVAHHFGSRDALLLEALKFSAEESIEASSLLAGSGRLEDYLVGLADLVANHPDAQIFQYELMLESRRRPQLRAYADELQRMYRDAAHTGLAKLGFTDPDLADLVHSVLDGVLFEQLTVGSRQESLRRIATLRHVLGSMRPGSPVNATSVDT